MSIFEVGRLCVKKAGREAGKKCVIVETIDKNYVVITGPRELTAVKRRRANIDHLEPLETKLPIKRGAEDKDVAKVLKKTLPEEFSPEKIEEKEEVKIEEKPEKKVEAKKAAKPRKRTIKKKEKTELKEKSQNE